MNRLYYNWLYKEEEKLGKLHDRAIKLGEREKARKISNKFYELRFNHYKKLIKEISKLELGLLKEKDTNEKKILTEILLDAISESEEYARELNIFVIDYTENYFNYIKE